MSLNFTGVSRGITVPGVYVGVISKINGVQVYVKITHVWGDAQLGPCEMCEFPGTPSLTTGTASPSDPQGGSISHNHPGRETAAQLAVGDRVIVGFLEGSPTMPVVLGRLAGR